MKLEQTVLLKALEWSYEKALDGSGLFDSAYKVSTDYLEKTKSREAAANSIIDWQVAKCATSGFITGLGGLITLPVAIPANISSVLLFQLRMILSIALLRGFDPRTEKVRSLVFLCLTGNATTRILKEVEIDIGEEVRENAMLRISDQVVRRINYLVKVRLFTKTGRIGLLKLGKVIPLLGGIVGGTLDAAATKEIGKAAKRIFINPSLS